MSHKTLCCVIWGRKTASVCVHDRHDFPPNVFQHGWVNPQAVAVEGLSMLCSCAPLAVVNWQDPKIIVYREITRNHLVYLLQSLLFFHLFNNHLELIC